MLRASLQAVARACWKLSTVGFSCGAHIVRYQMYEEIKRSLEDFDLKSATTLSLSHSQALCGEIGLNPEKIVDANYPEHDVCSLSKLPADHFDLIVSDQVWEHIECEPQAAVDACQRVLKPGGLAIHTTCFLTPFHGNPKYGVPGEGDFWRFTPHGLMYLHRKHSRVVSADGWGNPWMTVVNGLGLTRLPVPHARWHPIRMLAKYNRRSYAFVVWIIAQK
jgi:SAM-dependent methyltransferase